MATREKQSRTSHRCGFDTPPSKSVIFTASTFFQQRRAVSLPAPEKVRRINRKSGNEDAERFNRPPPVTIPSLGLFIKYGADVTVAEAETQLLMYERLQGQVPVPEIFGWMEDGEQVFIYMQLVQGQTMLARWPTLNEIERQSVCAQLKSVVAAWRGLRQEGGDAYIGKSAFCPTS